MQIICILIMYFTTFDNDTFERFKERYPGLRKAVAASLFMDLQKSLFEKKIKQAIEVLKAEERVI